VKEFGKSVDLTKISPNVKVVVFHNRVGLYKNDYCCSVNESTVYTDVVWWTVVLTSAWRCCRHTNADCLLHTLPQLGVSSSTSAWPRVDATSVTTRQHITSCRVFRNWTFSIA